MENRELIGVSAKFGALLDAVDLVGKVDSAVLIQGETGTGKEVIARAIHEASPRRRNRFVALNCAAIPSTLLESELFGYERGAFTGAVNQTIGRFQSADRGTLFLDEIGDLPLELQPKLLRVLQENNSNVWEEVTRSRRMCGSSRRRIRTLPVRSRSRNSELIFTTD
jgi:transcriptional regulator with GAF, ATPase, and Fis domain